MRRSGIVAVLLIAAAIAGLAGWRFATDWRPALAAYPIQGIDVSADTGFVDWPTAHADGVDFAYIRATSGADERDAQFGSNWGDAYAAGVRRGAIHVFSPCRPAVDQANNFIVTVPRTGDALPAALALDVDPACRFVPPRAALIGEVARFARIVERHTGQPILLVISPALEARYALSRALDRPLWATGRFFAPTYTSRAWRMWRANTRRIAAAEQPVGWDVVAP